MFGLLRPKQSNLGWLRDTPFLQTTIKKNHGYIHPSHQLRQGTPGGCEKWGVSKGITTGDINHSIYSEKPNPKSSMKPRLYNITTVNQHSTLDHHEIPWNSTKFHKIPIWWVVWNMFYFPNSWDDDPIWLSYFSGGWVYHHPDILSTINNHHH